MKHNLFIFLTAFIFIFSSCEKDDEVDVNSAEIVGVSITTRSTSADIEWTIKSEATLSQVYVEYSKNASFENSNQSEITKKATNKYSATLTSLSVNTTYYVRCKATNMYSSYINSDTYTFTTKPKSKPTLNTSSVTNKSTVSATCGGDVIDDGGATVTSRGVCYSTSPTPTTANTTKISGGGMGSFTCNLDELVPGTKYYVRAFATNSVGTSYGEQVDFTTTSTSSNATIKYKASSKLSETTTLSASGLHTNAFNTSIVSHTFSNGTGAIEFNSTLTSIGENAFYKCSGLTSVTIPNGVTNIGDRAFEYSGLTSVTIPENVKTTGKFPFSYCSNLTTVVWNAKNCTTYDDGEYFYPPFQEDDAITSFTIGNNVTNIPKGLCYKMPITSISIPSSVTNIGDRAFDGCTGLTSVTIPENVKTMGKNPFENCTNLTTVFWNAKNCTTYYDDVQNFNYPPFYGDSYITSFTIGSNVTNIPNGLCFGLPITSITIPSSVTSIGKAAFRGCTKLTTIKIPANVTSIDNAAFKDCSGLISIYCLAPTPPTVVAYAFDGVSKSIPVKVPSASVSKYKAADGWKEFTNIQAY